MKRIGRKAGERERGSDERSRHPFLPANRSKVDERCKQAGKGPRILPGSAVLPGFATRNRRSGWTLNCGNYFSPYYNEVFQP